MRHALSTGLIMVRPTDRHRAALLRRPMDNPAEDRGVLVDAPKCE